ncbi:4-hydroxythreonine-4-phosphate dehydrogenase PdxA [Rhizobiales bacterium]|uniref:4-hydroxythreonine-4-phosphate dehydrogenase PdxA n=1 Tax=Hongsoonwoonella zoysiae TaxID=2821844 RepID=UPI00155F8DE2|nr:4-hydroxythreonine-4-phosphate dehydrogenase PdxA [Hongsoonwoonella zoysiae]NRG18942.1 4-hydroxythreonine-4-phosphate dehydrogenase PdxA [Hongsoonwoonella zoysiae]
MRNPSLPLAVTLGEPAGIGPDITLMAWSRRMREGLPAFYVLGDADLLQKRAQRLNLNVPIKQVEPGDTVEVFNDALPVVPVAIGLDDLPGEPVPGSGKAVVKSIEQAVEDVRSGVASAVVTNPISKKVLYDAGFTYPGHTEFLGALAAKFEGGWRQAVMLLAGPDMLVVPVTVHIPLKDVPSALTRELIVSTAKIVTRDLQERFGIADPHLAICGLNPHAGENGTMGREEVEIIAPAIDELKAAGITATGPHPADTLFHERARETYDCALAMYHDQALVPVKTVAFDEAVNATLGLPFVRTSPDHGTAFSLAGTGKARSTSFEAAVRLAAALADPRTID